MIENFDKSRIVLNLLILSRTYNPYILLKHLRVFQFKRLLLLNQLPRALIGPLLRLDLVRGVKGCGALVISSFQCLVLLYLCLALRVHFHTVRVYLESIEISHLALLAFLPFVDVFVKLSRL